MGYLFFIKLNSSQCLLDNVRIMGIDEHTHSFKHPGTQHSKFRVIVILLAWFEFSCANNAFPLAMASNLKIDVVVFSKSEVER